MPSRDLPERGRADTQHMLRLERRIRLLERGRQTKPHRMATAANLDTTTEQTVTPITLDVGPGAWVVDGRVNVFYPTTDAIELAFVSLSAVDINTGGDLGTIGPTITMRWKGTASANDMAQNFAPVGHLTTTVPIRIEMRVQLESGTASHDVSLTELWLHASPL